METSAVALHRRADHPPAQEDDLPTLAFQTLDVFTSVRFGGNPLAVVLDGRGLADEAMQAIARELNLSETVFLLPPTDPASTARVRIFTPARELPFAGHPTLGTAVLLARLGRGVAASVPGATQIRLEEGIGPVDVVVRDRDSQAPYAEMRAPALPAPGGTPPSDAELAGLLGVAAAEIGFGRHRPVIFGAGISFLFVPLASRDVLARVRFDAHAWNRLVGARADAGAYLFCLGSEGGADLHARMFSPGAGIAEDPATGSAAAILAGPLASAADLPDGTHSWEIAQGEDMGRPSRIILTLHSAGGRPSAIRVGGHAVAVARGELMA